MRLFALLLSVALTGSWSPAVGQGKPVDRAHEGDWYVADATDNNTGEREVYAFQSYFPKDSNGIIMLKMKCFRDRPTLFVEWEEAGFPDQAVIAVSAVNADGTNPSSAPYIFEKSAEVVDPGMWAAPDVSAQVIARIGNAPRVYLVAQVAPRAKTVEFDVNGTPGAWARVSRHCPVRRLPMPPL